jgi:hypothetical protein
MTNNKQQLISKALNLLDPSSKELQSNLEAWEEKDLEFLIQHETQHKLYHQHKTSKIFTSDNNKAEKLSKKEKLA